MVEQAGFGAILGETAGDRAEAGVGLGVVVARAEEAERVGGLSRGKVGGVGCRTGRRAGRDDFQVVAAGEQRREATCNRIASAVVRRIHFQCSCDVFAVGLTSGKLTLRTSFEEVRYKNSSQDRDNRDYDHKLDQRKASSFFLHEHLEFTSKVMDLSTVRDLSVAVDQIIPPWVHLGQFVKNSLPKSFQVVSR